MGMKECYLLFLSARRAVVSHLQWLLFPEKKNGRNKTSCYIVQGMQMLYEQHLPLCSTLTRTQEIQPLNHIGFLSLFSARLSSIIAAVLGRYFVINLSPNSPSLLPYKKHHTLCFDGSCVTPARVLSPKRRKEEEKLRVTWCKICRC